MITLEKIDYVMDATGADYKIVRIALLENDGDVDKTIKAIKESLSSFEKSKSEKDNITFDEIKKVINDFWKQGIANRLVVKKKDEVILSLSLTVSAIGIIMAPFTALLGVGAGLISEYDFFIEMEDRSIVNLKDYILGYRDKK